MISRVLAVNPGSSSLKMSVVDADGRVALTRSTSPLETGAGSALAAICRESGLDAAGIRFVHGGSEFRQSTPIDDGVLERLAAIDLAPLHNPIALAAVAELRRGAPGLPLVACFDTAYHRTIADAAALYALPAAWQQRWALRRYGFHGLSHASAARRAATILARPQSGLRVVTCHLGAGASLCAVRDGRSVDTTMGFTPLDGLVMATRSGSVDPGLVLWLVRHGGLSPDAVEHGLENDAGLLGLSGISADMRSVLAAAEGGDTRATLAVDVYVHHLVRLLGAMTASAGGIDALVFTGGVGENSPAIRSRACRGVAHLGVDVDESRNRGAADGSVISAETSAVAVIVVRAAEDVEIARETRAALEHGRVPGG